ncbi:MAG: hypothetical protein ABI851_09050 [Saprospiraceae bacterium]
MAKVNIDKYLQLEQDLRRYRKALKQAYDVMMDQEITYFPIFVLHQEQLEMGVPLIEAGPTTGLWSIHASSLEEFVLKSLIHDDKVSEFRKVYQSHDHHFCIFVISELGAQFIFFPMEGELYQEYGTLN